ncbi:class I SAM-dependent methyltransferase [Brachybacterium sp. JHP9]|uniref:Class I SAM-dependent methyltransferase n=2 Tax=Brachybacterium equifaecis TaxID=2910770 RepID=A0ABT0R1T2_9MICO|nr:class I SAM-dependent methyltransferase [Brachybacterium equifaecis]
MDPRRAQNGLIRTAVQGLNTANQRHPWSHNDAFHSWILTRAPARRGLAIDIGCGRGELAAILANHFSTVHALDTDPDMRRATGQRCAGLANVHVENVPLDDLPQDADQITMIAVLHHLDLDTALRQVSHSLAPGGRFLCVGLARLDGPTDIAWDLACALTNPVIGYIRHPWPADSAATEAPIPTKEPRQSVDQIREALDRLMPGAVLRRRLAFRYTIEWTKPLQ